MTRPTHEPTSTHLPRWQRVAVVVVVVVAVALALPGCSGHNDRDPTVTRAARLPLRADVVEQLPKSIPHDDAKAALGRRFFFDTRLSGDGSIACASCHDIQNGGDDGRAIAIGIHGTRGTRNTPTVLNAALNFTQFWDGRASTLVEQAKGPVSNPREMGASWPQVVDVLSQDSELVARVRHVYHAPISADVVADAIAHYEATLLTPDSPFDRFLGGDAGALDADAREGWRMFRTLGCIACHQGRGLGGNMFQTFGVYDDDAEGAATDLGRFDATHDVDDRHVFKVPGLRNVALTAPYFHDGSAATLTEAVHRMARSQLGRSLDDAQTRAVVAFLESLTGRVPDAERAPPQAPSRDDNAIDDTIDAMEETNVATAEDAEDEG